MVKTIFIFILSILFLACDSEIKRQYKKTKRLSASVKIEDWEKAIKQYEEIINIQVNARENQLYIYRKLGQKHMQLSHWNDALNNFKKAAEIISTEGVIHYQLGICYSQLSRAENDENKKMDLIRSAEKEYKLAISLDSKLVDPYFGLGIIYFYVYKDYFKGIEYMAEVINREPRNIDAFFSLARFYYEIGESGKAIEFYKALLSIIPEKDERYEKVKENIQRINNELRGGVQ